MKIGRIMAILVIFVMIEDYGLEVLMKTPGLYEVPKLRKLNFDFFSKIVDQLPTELLILAASSQLKISRKVN